MPSIAPQAHRPHLDDSDDALGSESNDPTAPPAQADNNFRRTSDVQTPRPAGSVERRRSRPHTRLYFTNINGIKSKFGELTHAVHTEQPDLVVVVESKLDAEKMSDAELEIRGYGAPVARRDRTAHGGGILVWCKTGLAPSADPSPVSTV